MNETYEVRIVVGAYDGKKALIENRTPMDFLDFQLYGNGEAKYKANNGWNTFVIVYEGVLLINEQKFTKNTAVYFKERKLFSKTLQIKNLLNSFAYQVS